MTGKGKSEVPERDFRQYYPFLAGIWLVISLLKMGNPVVLYQQIIPPSGIAEYLITAWPLSWGVIIGGVVLAIGFLLAKPILPSRLILFFMAPLAWFFWQLLAMARSITPELSKVVVLHFGICLAAYLIGAWTLGKISTRHLWFMLLGGMSIVFLLGFDQHFGGLEHTRKQFHALPNWQEFPREYILKMNSDRIFSTLVYPNALAGVILLLFPILLFQLISRIPTSSHFSRIFLLALFIYGAGGCFYWTGSKAGWLIAIVVGTVALLFSKFPTRQKIIIVTLLLLGGVGGFFLKYQTYFQKGATSATARFVYWKGAASNTGTNPILGTGPGSFAKVFQRIKPPDAEMARLVHNDYLQQASDSGIPGAIFYSLFILGTLWFTRPQGEGIFQTETFYLWLGFLGWALQGLFEFGLYIPALAWPAFLIAGLLWSGKMVRQSGPGGQSSGLTQ
ncbi:MAG: O-antigen ligase family protein [Verrucomicrobiota bacterium]|nr:O-antigen ligase family protein [Verrucomicrobiota bacterium]